MRLQVALVLAHEVPEEIVGQLDLVLVVHSDRQKDFALMRRFGLRLQVVLSV